MHKYFPLKFIGALPLFAVFLLTAFNIPVIAQDSAPLPLFVYSTALAKPSSNLNNQNLNQITINLDKETVRRMLQGNVNTISVSVLGHQINFSRKNSSFSGKLKTWSGKDETGEYDISLTISEDHLFGKIWGKNGNFLLQPSGKSFEIIQTIQDSSKEVELINDGREESSNNLRFNSDNTLMDSTGDDGTRLDVMVLYTKGMAAAYPGTLIDTRIQYLIDQTNLAFTNSNVNTQLRLVRSKVVDYVDDSPSGLGEALDDLSDNIGVFDGIEEERDAYGADQVTLLRTFVDEGCGLATVIKNGGASSAYSVVHDGSKTDGSGFFCNDLTYAHELGHNLGLVHDRANSGFPGFFSYSYGYKNPATPFRTVMSYNCSGVNCPRIPHFSNPNVNYQDDPTGIPENQSDSADSAKSINFRRTAMATYRSEVEYDASLKRAELSKYVLLAKNGYSYTPPSSATGVFNDVLSTDFNADWIEVLYSEGITEGCAESGALISYCPNEMVTKEQLAKILLKAKHGSSYNPPAFQGGVFSDITSTSFNANWIEALSDQGISTGCGNGNFCPKDGVTLQGFFSMLGKTFP